MKSGFWFAHEKFAGGISKLLGPTTELGPDAEIKDAEAITIFVEGAFPAFAFDKRRRRKPAHNDLIITTKHLIGSKPSVDKLHFLQRDYPPQKWAGPFFHPVVWTTKDFRGETDSDITIQVRVYDEDGLTPEQQSAISDGLKGATTALSFAFPAFAPFAGLASGLGTSLVNLIDRLDEHDQIVDVTFNLRANRPPLGGWEIMQPGFFVCFDKDVNGDELALNSTRRIVFADSGKDFVDSSYVVLRVERGNRLNPDMMIEEDAATLLSELDQGKGMHGSHALKFVEETFTTYTTYKKLKRAKQLRDKGDKVTAEERTLLDELMAVPDIAMFFE